MWRDDEGKRQPFDSAAKCRFNGWEVGTWLQKGINSGFVIEITAIGVVGVLAKVICRNGDKRQNFYEANFSLSDDDWMEVK